MNLATFKTLATKAEILFLSNEKQIKKMRAIETTGVFNNENIIEIKHKIKPEFFNKSVRILILFGDENHQTNEIDETLWLKSMSQNSAFDFLMDNEEDIYSIEDGKPFEYEA